jgi:MYXO-CTERM domain-containing protein
MLSILLLSLSAYAILPSSQTFIGAEPTRMRRYHVARQYSARHADPWRAFLDGEGAGWAARFDERTDTPHRAWGPGIELGEIANAQDLEAKLRAFFGRNAALLGIPVDALQLGKHGHVPSTDTWLVDFDQVVDGVTVWRSGVTVRVRHGRILMFGVNTVPGAMQVDTTPAITGQEAALRAMGMGPAGNSTHTDVQHRAMILARDIEGQLQSQLVWEVRSQTKTPIGHWVSFVDAQSGELLHVYNEVRFLSGTLSAEHDTRTVDGNTSVSPLPYFRVDSDEAYAYADEDGAWTLEGDLPVTGSFDGDFIELHNEAGAEATFEDLTGDVMLTQDDATRAELSAYVFQHQIREWSLRYAPDLSLNNHQVDVHVNEDDSCNAYFDGDLHFMVGGRGCNNTGRIADVNYHEWGHAFHYWNMVTGVFDGSISEGVSDVISALNTGDPTIAPYFYTSGHAIREMSTDKVYPDDWVDEVHADGLIFAGAVWDLWTELENIMDEDAAYDLVSTLVVKAMRGGPEIPDVYDEFVFADDDNDDLSDGTPHLCEIISAFTRHGLGPGGNSALMLIGHLPLENQSANTAMEITADIVNMAPSCVDLEVQAARAFYSIDEGENWLINVLDVEDNSLNGVLPSQATGTVVQYYLEVQTPEGNVTVPKGGIINPFTFFVGELEEVYCEDFEADDGGYTHTLLSGSGEEGADDWAWGTPVGSAGDPDYAFSGDKVWGNDLGGGRANGEYQNDKHNRLKSPTIQVGEHQSVLLQYRRWLNVEDGYFDQALITANSETVWSNHASYRSIGDEHHQDEQWGLHTVPLSIEGGSLTLSWEIISDQGLAMGGWNIDDVCVYVVTDIVEEEEDEAPEENIAEPSDAGSTSPVIMGDLRGSETKRGCGCASAAQPWKGGLALFAFLGVWGASRRREQDGISHP